MALIACAECGHQISTQAAACPQCGHPQAVPLPSAPGPKCHRCSEAATARCQCCGKFCCLVHLLPIYVRRGKRGTNELRCPTCKQHAEETNEANRQLGCVLTLLILAFVVFVIITAGR